MDRKTLTSLIKNRIDLGQAHTGNKVHAFSRARGSRREDYLEYCAGSRLELGRSASSFWGGSEPCPLVVRSGIRSSSHHYFLPAPSGTAKESRTISYRTDQVGRHKLCLTWVNPAHSRGLNRKRSGPGCGPVHGKKLIAVTNSRVYT
jgi:hypothetical protein